MGRYALTIFVGAFLLFQVQPVLGKYILPWFGSSPAVWTTCLLFFQCLLLAGYLYAHLIVSRLSQRAQAITHIALVGATLLLLPITPSDAWKPEVQTDPTLQILLLLSVTVGVPYLLLAATGPLLQGWFARSHPGRSPYPLYALSNAASLLALISYPLVFERFLRLDTQTTSWSAAYVAYALLCGACAWSLLRRSAAGDLQTPPGARSRRTDGETPSPTRPGARRLLIWLALSACGSGLLMATTNQMCQDVAVVPFLWVLPLALYLLTFVICFDSERWYVRPLFCALLPLALLGACLALYGGPDLEIGTLILAYSFALFICCMCCHGELARLKPHPRHLTLFYLMISTGGALGGVLVAFVAPRVFDGYFEYHLLLGTCYLLVLGLVCRDWLRGPIVHRRTALVRTLAAGGWVAFVGATAAFLFLYFELPAWQGEDPDVMEAAGVHDWLARSKHVACVMPLILLVGIDVLKRGRRSEHEGDPASIGWPRKVLIATAAMGLVPVIGALGWHARQDQAHLVAQQRNFYGVLYVVESDARSEAHTYTQYHGRIVHGHQVRTPKRRGWPTSYYGPRTGIGLAIRHHPSRHAEGRQFRMGVVGLGTGTLAAYANARVDPRATDGAYVVPVQRQPGDHVAFYEINPLVARWADEYFTYRRDALARGAHAPVYLGDARIVLEQQLVRSGSQRFDVLAIDAFNGAAIPFHLLTRECIALYWQHLNPDGILVIHVSNRFLELTPVVQRLARHFDKETVLVVSEQDDEMDQVESSWVLMTSNAAFLAHEAVSRRRVAEDLGAPLWTDDFSSVLPLLRAD